MEGWTRGIAGLIWGGAEEVERRAGRLGAAKTREAKSQRWLKFRAPGRDCGLSYCVLFFNSVQLPCLSDLLSDVIYAYIQVERKRHIGNDIVTIVFQEGEEPSPAFKPSMIRSHFTRILGLRERSRLASCCSASLDLK